MLKLKRRPMAVLSQSILLIAGMTATGLAADGPHVGPNVRVNDPQQAFPVDFQTRTTTTLGASDDGQRLLAGWEDFRGLCGPPSNQACPPEDPAGIVGFGFSVDGGITWTDGGAVPGVGTDLIYGHPWIDSGVVGGHGDHGGGHDRNHDDHGDRSRETFFLASRLRDGATGVPRGFSVHRGHFAAGNFTFDDGQAITPATTEAYTRPAIAASKDGSNAAYVVAIHSIGICNIPFAGLGQVEVYRSHDGGDSWQGPAVVSPEPAEVTDPNDPLCGLEGPEQVAPAPAIGPNGEVYVIWQYGPNFQIDRPSAYLSAIDFSRSLNGGQTFSAPHRLVDIFANRNNQPVGYAKSRMNDQPRIAVAQSGPHRGRIYVAFYQPVQLVTTDNTAQSLVSTQIYMMHSDNQGVTWSTPRTIGAPVPATRVKRFWPTVSVRPDGTVDVVYLESQEVQLNPDPTVVGCNVPIGGGPRRIGPATSLVDTYLLQSRDGDDTWGTPIRISSATTNWCLANYRLPGTQNLSNLGDYIGSASAGDRTFAVWPDARNSFIDVFFGSVEGKSGHDDDHGHGH
jgi:hypothetical protein